MSKFTVLKKIVKEILPLDNASRLQRAKELGYDTDKVWYHGTRGDIDEFKINPKGINIYGKGVYLTDNPEEAAQYANAVRKGAIEQETRSGPNILPIRAKTEKPFDLSKVYTPDDPELSGLKEILNDPDKWDIARSDEVTRQILYDTLKRRFGQEKVIDAIQKLGYDSMIIPRKSLTDDKTFRNLVVFDPKNVRSVNANFDPAMKDSAAITAGLAATMLGSDDLLSEEDDKVKFKKTKQAVSKKE